jgi:lantibiotic modifying enzyme
MDKHTFLSLYRGISGTIWLLCKLKKSGFEINSADKNISINLNFLKSEFRRKKEYMSPSYYYGTTGISIAIHKAIECQLLSGDPEDYRILEDCFQNQCKAFNLIYGVAGQGIAAMQIDDLTEKSLISKQLEKYSITLIQNQEIDGSWIESSTEEKTNGFGYGIAGIVYFLLVYGDKYKNQQASIAAEKGLSYLKNKLRKVENYYAWPISNKNKSISSWWCKGSPGIALAFLKGYEITKNSKYRQIAEKALLIHPPTPVYNKLGQCHGLSGLGEIYLEAHRVTKQQEWLDRATWIAHLIINLRKQSEKGYTYWLVENSDFPTSDLMIGNGGVIHFLARFISPDKIGFPLLNH